MAKNKMTETELRDPITRAPVHKWLGVNPVEMNEDGIKVSIPWREEFVVHPKAGYTHGGIPATVIDMAAGYALAAKLGGSIPTVDLRVDYRRPALQGERTVEGRVKKLGRTFSTAEAYVYESDGALLASGRGVYHSPPSS